MESLPPPRSEAERIARLSDEDRAAWLAQPNNDLTLKYYDWQFWQRTDQAPPPGDWSAWLVLAGRGYGKTRMGAEWVRAKAESQPGASIAIVGSTSAEARSIMVEGHSGLLRIAPPPLRPLWEPSLKKLTWTNGSTAYIYSAAEPDSLRGPSHHFAWCDEIAKWDRGVDAWDNLAMTMRMGSQPQVVATTTPRPVPLLRVLGARGDVSVTRGTMDDNALHVSPQWRATMRVTYGKTRLGRQELDGEMIDDVEGALWSRDLIECCRVAAAPVLTRIVIGVDPPITSGGDECGIIVAGLGVDGHAYVLADCSVSGRSPDGWARAVANAHQVWNADRVIAEGNQGGEMVESILRGANVMMPVKRVHARHGKVARAEPVFMLYDGGRIKHVGSFPVLEDQLCGLIVGGGYAGPGRSPDRADALVWAMTELMLGGVREPRVRGV